MFKKISLWLFLTTTLFLLFLLFLLGRTYYKSSMQKDYQKNSRYANINLSKAPERLAKAISYPTISSQIDSTVFHSFHQHLKRSYPLCFENMEVHSIGLSWVMRWKGKNKGKGSLLNAHYDVVEVDGLKHWGHAPYDSIIKDGYIHGRGSLDDKSSLLALLESCEALIKKKFQPEKDIFILVGHDEETGGNDGAHQMALWLQKKRYQVGFTLDEGMAVTQGIFPGLSKDLALIGIAEKGYLSLALNYQGPGGHSAMPPEKSTIDILSEALLRIKKANESEMHPLMDAFLSHIGPELPFAKRLVFANKDIFQSLILKAFSDKASTRALLQNTIAPTIFKAGHQENVIPQTGTVILNIRTLPHYEESEIIKWMEAQIADLNISIQVLSYEPPSKISPVDHPDFQKLMGAIQHTFPNTITAPSLVLAGTDSKHYQQISDRIYRFAPLVLSSSDLSRIHGKDERISVKNYHKMIDFYYYLVQQL